MLANILTDFQNWISLRHVEKLMGTPWGYSVLFGLLFSCGLGLPLPEDIPLMLAGYFVANGKMHLGIAAVCAWLGILAGDCMLYMFGRHYGMAITKVPFIGKHFTSERIKLAELLFQHYGIWVVGIGRMFAGIRGAMVVAAGTIRYSFIPFIIADALAAIVSGGLFMSLGYWAGTKLGDLEALRDKIEHYERYVLGGLVLLILAFAIWKSTRPKPIQEPSA
jgi:membrane protein DedA with SNARE-associated domain